MSNQGEGREERKGDKEVDGMCERRSGKLNERKKIS